MKYMILYLLKKKRSVFIVERFRRVSLQGVRRHLTGGRETRGRGVGMYRGEGGADQPSELNLLKPS